MINNTSVGSETLLLISASHEALTQTSYLISLFPLLSLILHHALSEDGRSTTLCGIDWTNEQVSNKTYEDPGNQ